MTPMTPSLRRLLVRLPVAAFAAILIWLAGFSQPYTSAVAAFTEKSIRLFERPRVTMLSIDEGVLVIHRSDLGPGEDTPALDPSPITGNVIILMALIWGATGFGRKIGFRAALLGLAILFASQVIHLALTVETLYATQLGEWSVVAYPRWERETLATSRYFFDIVLVYALPFLIWGWLAGFPSRHAEGQAPAEPEGGRGRPLSRRKRRATRSV